MHKESGTTTEGAGTWEVQTPPPRPLLPLLTLSLQFYPVFRIFFPFLLPPNVIQSTSLYPSDPAQKVAFNTNWEIVFSSRQKHFHSSKRKLSN